jgi:cardiolipin synthase A/B
VRDGRLRTNIGKVATLDKDTGTSAATATTRRRPRVLLGRGRGVDVRAILPRSNDSKTARHAELVIANYFLSHGVRVYVYPGMSHVKALLVDGWACVGSANLNQFGLKLCQEHNIATSDPAFSARLKKHIFEADFDKSYELTKAVSTQWMDWLADIVVEGL